MRSLSNACFNGDVDDVDVGPFERYAPVLADMVGKKERGGKRERGKGGRGERGKGGKGYAVGTETKSGNSLFL